MEPGGSAFAPAVRRTWGQHQNLAPGLALVALAAAGWTYAAYHPNSTGSMAMGGPGAAAVFLAGWTAMMTAMMVPATLPLILLYRTIARRQPGPARSRTGMVVLLAGYLGVWAAAGTPVYGYSLLTTAGSLAAVLPALLLVAGGIYQFTPLKRICQARCSSPLFFLLHNWRQGPAGALRLGVVHGRD